MSRSGHAILALLVVSVTLSSGCSRSLATALPPVPNLDLPEAVPQRAALPPDQATLVYPQGDKTERDPFLSVAEQAVADDRKDLAGPGSRTLDAPVHVLASRMPYQKVIAQLHKEVKGIVLGAPNVFIFEGHPYEEGDVIESTDWVVLSIQETGIKLRSKDGSGSDYLRFNTLPSINFEFKGDDQASTAEDRGAKPAPGGQR